MARKIGTAPQSIYKYEKNIVTNIPLSKVELMAKLFDVNPAVLVGWDEESDDPPESWFDVVEGVEHLPKELSDSLAKFNLEYIESWRKDLCLPLLRGKSSEEGLLLLSWRQASEDDREVVVAALRKYGMRYQEDQRSTNAG